MGVILNIHHDPGSGLLGLLGPRAFSSQETALKDVSEAASALAAALVFFQFVHLKMFSRT